MKLRALLWLRLLLVAFVVLLSARGSFAANFSLSLNSAAGDPVGMGASKFFDQSNATNPTQSANPSLYFYVKSNGTPSEGWTLEFRAPAGGPLAPGIYEVDTANVNGSDLYQSFFYVRPFGTNVSRVRGQFEVKRMVYSANSGVSLWISFTQYVNGSSAALTGEFKVEAETDLVPNNLAPRVYAGPDLAVDMGAAVPFRAVVQDDGLPAGAVSVKWENASSSLGPILISAPESTETTVTFMAEGTYNLKVTASDGVLSYSRVVTVYVRPSETFNLFKLQLPVRLINTPAGVLELRGTRDKFSIPSFSSGMALKVEDTTVSWTEAWDLAFTLPNGLKPSVGTYPVAKTNTSVPGAMTVKIQRGLSGSALPVLGGSVQILAIEYASGGSMTRCHALFSLYTDEFTPPVLGEIRFRIDPDLADTKPFVTAGMDQAFTSMEIPEVRGGVLVRGSSASTPQVRWSKVSGPGDVVFTEPTAVVTPVTLSAPGTYVLRLEATDDSGVHSDEVEVTALGYEVSIVTKSLGRSDAYFPPLHRMTATFKDGVLTFETMNKKTFSSQEFHFRTSDGQPLPGIYRTDDDMPNNWTWIGVPFGFDGEGQFELRELVLDDRGAVVSAWVKYKMNLNNWDSPDYTNVEGEIRFHTAAVEAAVNRAPLVNVGLDLVTDSYSQQLVASIADDLLPYGRPLQYSWKLLSGPTSVELETPGAYKTTAKFFEPGVYRFLFTVTDGELTSTDELVVVFKSTNRSYEGLVRVGESIVGRAVIKLTPRNAFTARVQVGKGTLTLKGNLADGGWDRNGVDSAGQEVSISFSRTTSGEAVTGYISVGGQTLRITTRQTFGSFQRLTREKCPYQGRYTHVLLPPQGVAGTGAGYGDIVVQPSGAYRLKGTLADGVPFSIGGNLTIGGDLELYLRLRNGREHVVGAVSFSEQGVDGLIGGLGWHREASLKEPIFGGGLDLSLYVRGSRYQAPPKGSTIFPPAANAMANIRLFDSSFFPNSIVAQLTFTGEQLQVAGAPEGFTVKFDARTGYFKGGFKDPVTSATRSFGGVILQGLKTGAGFFLMEGHSGGVSLQVAE